MGGQSVGASTSIFPMSIQGWFPLGLTRLNSLQSKGFLSRIFSSTAVRGHQFFCTQPSLWSNSHICKWVLEKPYTDCHIYIYKHNFPMLELKHLDNYSTRLLTHFLFLYFILLSFLAFYHSDFVLGSILYTRHCSACWQDLQGLTLTVKVKVAQSCLALWPPDCSTLGFPVLHYLPEFAQTHVHWVSDAIQPSHPLSPPSLFALNLSQHQSLFQWLSSSHQVAKV